MSLPMPQELRNELVVKMRRNADEFRVIGRGKCKFCGRKNAYELGHENNVRNAGAFCLIHGWLFFNSPGASITDAEIASGLIPGPTAHSAKSENSSMNAGQTKTTPITSDVTNELGTKVQKMLEQQREVWTDILVPV